MFWKLFCLLCIAYSLPVISTSGIPGGINQIPVDSKEVIRLQEFILDKLNEGAGVEDKKSLIEVTEATRQVVSGTLTKLTIRISEGTEKTEKICEVTVWEQPWQNKIEITKSNCRDVPKSAKRIKKQVILGGDGHDTHIGLFDDFIKKHGKVYKDRKEYKKRYHIFRTNMKKIRMLQESEQGTAKYGPTWFADLSPKEFQQYLGLKKPMKVEKLPEAVIPNVKLPEAFDWRDYNVVTPVKNQEACGSCWAFSVTGNIEGQWALKNKELLSLSEQELIDCDSDDDGCGGGYMTTAYNSIVKIGGLETERDYPYEAENEQCHLDQSAIKVQISGGVNITKNETSMAQWMVSNGPMSVGLNANAMQFYMGGVSHPFKVLCDPSELDHGVLIVGYGVHHSKILKRTLPYWLIKNSWGTRWGELGYYKLYRGDGSCGINQMVTSAVLN